MSKRFRAYPIGLRYVNELIVRWHRHHGPVVGFKAAWVALEGHRPCACATLSRPVARRLDNGSTLEITRLAADGTEHVCSFLYGFACRQAERVFGAERVITYLLEDEPGTSVKAAGFCFDGYTPGRSWSVPSRPREDAHPLGRKQRWVRELHPKRRKEKQMPRQTVEGRVLARTTEAMGWLADAICAQQMALERGQLALEELRLVYSDLRATNVSITQDVRNAA